MFLILLGTAVLRAWLVREQVELDRGRGVLVFRRRVGTSRREVEVPFDEVGTLRVDGDDPVGGMGFGRRPWRVFADGVDLWLLSPCPSQEDARLAAESIAAWSGLPYAGHEPAAR